MTFGIGMSSEFDEIFILEAKKKEDINISGLPLDCFSLIFSWLSKFFLGDYIERDCGVDLLWPQQVEVYVGFPGVS